MACQVRRHGRIRRQAVEGVGGRERQAQEAARRSAPGYACPEERFRTKALAPQVRREAIGQIIERFDLSERRACRLVGLTRSSYRHPPVPDQQPIPQRQRPTQSGRWELAIFQPLVRARRFRAKLLHRTDVGRATARRRTAIPQPYHGHPHNGSLRCTGRPAMRGSADRALWISDNRYSLLHRRPYLHRPRSCPVAQKSLAKPVSKNF